MPPAHSTPASPPPVPISPASQLRGLVEAPRYAEGRAMQVVEASAPLRRSPAPDAPLETEALYGEAVTVYDESEGWAWAQLDRDLYVGYLPLAALGAPSAPTHRVPALRTHAYPGPSIKLPPRLALSLGARLTIVAPGRRFRGDARRSAALGAPSRGRRRARTGLRRGRRAVPRDALSLGRADVRGDRLLGPRADRAHRRRNRRPARQRHAGGRPRRARRCRRPAPLARGDLVFWKGHVGIMRDAETLLHANGWHMKVVSEPLAEARARIAASGGGR